MSNNDHPDHGIDAMLPAEIAEKAEGVGVKKAQLDVVSLVALAVLAGAFIAFGAMFATTVLAGADAMPFGVSRLLAGIVFGLGLILCVLGGAELFTGNTLMVMAWAAGKLPLVTMLRAWTIVYIGNFIGAVGTALLVFLSGQYLAGHGSVAAVVLNIAAVKTALPFWNAVFLGILCNVLVCLAVWLALGARTTTDKVLAVPVPSFRFRRSRFRALGRQYVFYPARPFREDLGAGRYVVPARHQRGGLWRAHMAVVFPQPDPGHHRQHHRRRRAGRRRLLVHLPAPALTADLPHILSSGSSAAAMSLPAWSSDPCPACR